MATTLTDRALRAMKPKADGTQTEAFDAQVRGLSARCSRSGVAFAFTYTSPATSKRRRVTIGSYPAWPLADARRRALDLRRMVEDGVDPAEEAKREASRITVAELVARYVAAIKPRHRTWAKIQRSLERDFVERVGHVPAHELTRRQIIEVLDAVAGRGAAVHANRLRDMISAMMRWAVSEGFVDANPAQAIGDRTVEKPKARFFTAAEIRVLLPHLVALPSGKRDALLLGLLLGVRPGEAAGIRAREVDLTAKTWTIPGSRSKNKREHSLPLTGRALTIVQELVDGAREVDLRRHDGRLILVRERGVRPLSTTNLAHALSAALTAAGIKDPATPHDLRRTTATHLARLKHPPHIIAAVLNHVSIVRAGVTGGVYNQHDYLPEITTALSDWDRELERILTDQLGIEADSLTGE